MKRRIYLRRKAAWEQDDPEETFSVDIANSICGSDVEDLSNVPQNEGNNANAAGQQDYVIPVFLANFLQQIANAPMFQPPPPLPQRVITFKSLKENGAEEFLGDRIAEPQIAWNWIEQTARVLKDLNVPLNDHPRLATQLLRGEAYEWWKRIDESNETPKPWTWEFFDWAFKKEYIPTRFCEAKHTEFVELQQGDMTLPEYRQKFISLAKFAPTLVSTTTDCIEEFRSKLRPDLRAQVSIIPTLWLVIKNGKETAMKKVGEKLVPKTEDKFDTEDIKKVENYAKAINMLYCTVNPDDYRKISCCTTAKEMWDKLEVTYEGRYNMFTHLMLILLYIFHQSFFKNASIMAGGKSKSKASKKKSTIEASSSASPPFPYLDGSFLEFGSEEELTRFLTHFAKRPISPPRVLPELFPQQKGYHDLDNQLKELGLWPFVSKSRTSYNPAFVRAFYSNLRCAGDTIHSSINLYDIEIDLPISHTSLFNEDLKVIHAIIHGASINWAKFVMIHMADCASIATERSLPYAFLVMDLIVASDIHIAGPDTKMTKIWIIQDSTFRKKSGDRDDAGPSRARVSAHAPTPAPARASLQSIRDTLNRLTLTVDDMGQYMERMDWMLQRQYHDMTAFFRDINYVPPPFDSTILGQNFEGEDEDNFEDAVDSDPMDVEDDEDDDEDEDEEADA
ncbi:unnamed protein product [Cuscuta campestris]|uniref:Retrotransposon gag domain-containing protein n=1 Tax=Cuscuta campestris TaxID=132261 RepID=A0A484LDT2_9ASTE|nr:unnamed protein product [Cuscuta campestris]